MINWPLEHTVFYQTAPAAVELQHHRPTHTILHQEKP